MKTQLSKLIALSSLVSFPAIAFAQTPSNLIQLISFAGDVLNRIIPLLIAAALVMFFWGLIKYVMGGKAKGAKDIMVAGLLALFVMTSVWGIIRLAQNTFGVNNSAIPSIPQVPQR